MIDNKFENRLMWQRFGKLTVVRFGYRADNGHVYWWCRCDCGRMVEVRESNLKSGHTKSCGCLKKGHNQRPMSLDQAWKELIQRWKRSAAVTDTRWELSDQEARQIASANCYICFAEPIIGFNDGTRYIFYYNHLAQKDPGSGYTKENAIALCDDCFRSKGNRSLEYFFEWHKRVKRPEDF